MSLHIKLGWFLNEAFRTLSFPFTFWFNKHPVAGQDFCCSQIRNSTPQAYVYTLHGTIHKISTGQPN